MMKPHYGCFLGAFCLTILVQAHQAGRTAVLSELTIRNTVSVPRPQLGSVPYGTIINNCAVPGTVALTYDDGPGPYTSELLDTLAANGIKATFFILGSRNDSIGPIDSAYPTLIQRMYQEGHQIASHTWNHASLESLNSAQRQAEMTMNEAAFANILGFWPTYMRPPYGFCYGASGCLSDMGNLGYHVIDWSVDTKDYENDSPTLIKNAENNWDAAFLAGNPQSSSFIPLTHDIHQNTVTTLAPYMIAEIKQKGYKFMTVGECLNDPASNWYRNATTGSTVVVNKALAQMANSSSSSSSSSSSMSMTSTARSSGTSTSAESSATSAHSSTTSSASSSASSHVSSSGAARTAISFVLSSTWSMLMVMAMA